MDTELLNQTLRTFRWVSRSLVAMSLLCSVLLLLLLLPSQESTALLIPVDQQSHFKCLSDGCWNRVRAETTLAEIATRTNTDERLLREGNPHIRGDIVHRGDEIRISEAMKPAH